MSTRIILLNGPPRSGKDTAAAHLRQTLPPLWRAAFADELKRRTHALYGMPMLEPLHFEPLKDQPLPEFLGLTPRQAYIGVSERLMKPLHGEDVFGRLLAARLQAEGGGRYVAPDSGFAAEVAPLLEAFGAENLLLIRIHAEGRGCSFAGDSRSYIALPGVRSFDVDNGTPGETKRFLAQVTAIVAEWLEGRGS